MIGEMKTEQGVPPDKRCFLSIKITLIIYNVLALIAFVILLVLAALALMAFSNKEVQDDLGRKDKTKEDLDLAKMACIYTILALVVSSVFIIIGLVGVIMEHKVTMIILSLISFLEVMYYLAVQNWFSVCLEAIMSVLIGGYAYMIEKREKYQAQNSIDCQSQL